MSTRFYLKRSSDRWKFRDRDQGLPHRKEAGNPNSLKLISLTVFVIYLDYRLYSSILFKMEISGLRKESLPSQIAADPEGQFSASTYKSSL